MFWFIDCQNLFWKMFLKTAVLWKLCRISRKISMIEFTVKELAVFRAATFLNDALHQISPLFWTMRSTKYNFLGIYEIFNITKSQYLDCQNWFHWGIISFDDQNFGVDSYSFFVSYEIVADNNIRQQVKWTFFQILSYSLSLPC